MSYITGADFCIRNRHLDRSQISMCFSFQSIHSISSPLLSFFFYFFSFISISVKARRSSCAYQVRGRLLLRLLLPLLASRLLSHFLNLPLCTLFLFLSLFFFFFFFSHFHSSVSYALRSNISSSGFTCIDCKTAPLGLWRITVSRSIYDSDCSQSAIVRYFCLESRTSKISRLMIIRQRLDTI